MSVLGIISEYNPYHTGHAHLLEQARELTGAEHAVSVMSGDFSQQGMPMSRDKYTRAAAASAAGIDLVFELPTLFACSSARDFALGGVTLLTRLGIPDTLCFGVEHPAPSMFSEIAACIAEEPELYRDTLQSSLKKGNAFPSAREDALAAVLGDRIRPVVREPNNILALEYMTAIRQTGSPLRPCLIKRSTGYHAGSPASATVIRNHLAMLYAESGSDSSGPSESPEDYLRQVLPPEVYPVFRSHAEHFLLSPEGLMPYLAACLLRLSGDAPEADLPMDMTPEMYHRLKKLRLPSDYETILTEMKRKNETRGRITRALLHLILDIREKDRLTVDELSKEPLYLNLLAARRESTFLLRNAEGIDIITKKADYRPSTSATARMWELDLKASRLYSQLYHDAFGVTLIDELQQSPEFV